MLRLLTSNFCCSHKARQFEKEARENLLQVTKTLQDKLLQTEEQRKRELETISTENDQQRCQLKAKVEYLFKLQCLKVW